jgi:hypothetical protein
MRASGFITLAVAVWSAAGTVRAQQHPDAEGLRASLTELLSLVTLGSLSVPDQSVQLMQSGGDIQVRLPLARFLAPAGAAAEAMAHSDGKGGWDITAMTFPSAGAIGQSIDSAVSYSVGQQSIHGRLDPRLVAPSTLAAGLRSITLKSVDGASDTEQTIERVVMDGRVTGAANGRLDLVTRHSVTNWRSAVQDDPAGPKATSHVQRFDGHFAVTELERAQGVRLMAAARAFMATVRSRGQQPGLASPGLASDERDGLRNILDATAGLSTRVEADETLDSVRLDLGHGNEGALGRMHMHMIGEARKQQLHAAADFEIDALSLSSVSAAAAEFVPRHLLAKAVVAGVPIGPLMALLRDALMPDPDALALQRQMAALLSAQDPRSSIESIAFDAGPAHLVGSVRLQPRANGEIGADIRVTATGIEALLVRLQRQPELQGVIPMVFMAKGMGRADGNSVVWDIRVDEGPMTVNGIPLGQPSGQTR